MIYGDKADYNASSVPPEWHGWLNYINDYTPKEVRGRLAIADRCSCAVVR